MARTLSARERQRQREREGGRAGGRDGGTGRERQGGGGVTSWTRFFKYIFEKRPVSASFGPPSARNFHLKSTALEARVLSQLPGLGPASLGQLTADHQQPLAA